MSAKPHSAKPAKSAEPKRGRGRPSTYDEALATEIAERISEGETLASICRDLQLPRRTIYNWMATDPAFSARFKQARDVGFHAIADYALDIADTVAASSEEVAKARLRVETRLKLLAKWSPGLYGEKLEHSGPGGGPIQYARVERRIVDPSASGPEKVA